MSKSRTPTYNSWQGMRKRCLDPKHKGFKDYGAKGITICESWLQSFDNFLSDMGEKPLGTSLDRIDNQLGYNKENCKWSTITEQNRNRSCNTSYTFNGETKSLIEFCEELNLEYRNVGHRLRVLKWSVDKAFSTPTVKPFNPNVNKQSYRKNKRLSSL